MNLIATGTAELAILALPCASRSDADGRFTFDTVRPGGYPNADEPQDIQFVVIEPGCGSYFVEDVRFDDPPFQTMSPEMSDRLLTGVFGSGVTSPMRDSETGVWHVARDVLLGVGEPRYVECER